MSQNIKNRLTALRVDMYANKIDAVIIPSGDAHQSEYIADYWAVREWLSGFTGSAGTLIVTKEYAAIWTDPRYFLQAEIELKNSSIVLHKQKIPHAPEHIPWLCKMLLPGQRIGIDSKLFSVSQLDYLSGFMSENNLTLNLNYDPIHRLWLDRPELPTQMIFEHDSQFCDTSRLEKMNLIRKKIQLFDADYLIVSTLDDIAWILNLRGNDISFNPLFYAFLLIGRNKSFLFVNEQKIDLNLKEKLIQEEIRILSYESLPSFISITESESSFIIHSESLNAAIFNLLPPEKIFIQPNWIMEMKAVKTKSEIDHIRNAMKKDGVALLRAYRWLENEMQQDRMVSEFAFGQKIAFFRSQQQNYIGESFHAIVGFKENGAIIHYHPSAENTALIKADGMLLTDSGAQYLDGTTDITRTIFFGKNPTPEMKKHFTLVLKGFISLASASFPSGTIGVQLDTLARLPLWKEGLNYAHGTGHGVGFFLSVHEGPQGFASNTTTTRGNTIFKPGMITTNEPGFYLQDKYGIRIENILLCVEMENGFLAFEDLTLFPISTVLIELNLLNQDEKDWLNNYHQLVWHLLSPMITKEEQDWLKTQCSPI